MIEAFLAFFPKDRVPIKLLHHPAKLIINLVISYLGESHWVAVYVPLHVFYFDPSGDLPPDNIKNLLQSNYSSGFRANHSKIQDYLSDKCGLFCVEFLKRCQNYSSFFKRFNHCGLNEKKLDS